MFIASVAHILAFPVTPYRRAERLNWILNIANAANVSDLHSEVAHHYNHLYGRVRGALRRKGESKEDLGARSGASSQPETDNDDIDETTGLLSEDLGNRTFFLSCLSK